MTAKKLKATITHNATEPRQFNIRVDRTVLDKFDYVREEMFMRNADISITNLIEEVLKESTAAGQDWLKQNANEPIDSDKQALIEKKREEKKSKQKG